MDSANSSTQPLPTPEDQLPPPEGPQLAFQEAVQAKAGINRLVGLRGLQSISRNLTWEDGQVDQWGRADFERVNGTAAGGNTTPPNNEAPQDDAVENLVAGNQTIENHYHQATPPAATPPNPPTPADKPAVEGKPAAEGKSLIPTIAPAGMGTLGKAAIIAGVLGSGVGGGYMLSQYLHPTRNTTINNTPTTGSDNITDTTFPP